MTQSDFSTGSTLSRVYCTAMFILSSAVVLAQRETLLNDGWLFSCEDTAIGIVVNEKTVALPHDWSVELPTQKDAPMGNDGGYFPAGKGHYVKTFVAKKGWQGRRNSLLFEGVYMNARVVMNGKELGCHAYGWTPFEMDITEALTYDGENRLEVFVDNSLQKNSRWYTGSGIYRNVWLRSLPTKDAIGDFAVKTHKEGEDYTLDVDFYAPSTSQNLNKPIAKLKDPSGAVVAEGHLPLKVKEPKEWSPTSPVLYTLTLNTSTDEVSTKVGFRTIAYSAEEGLVLNGERILLNGACVHADNGPLGAAAYKDAETRRVQLLKDAGFNAVRTAHNPSSTAFLEACDSIGMLVVSELLDKWRTACTQYDYASIFDRDWQDDVDSWVKRDVNHPSVWCWSVGNEVMERTDPECVSTARKLIGRVHSLDPSRPVTSAMCSWNQGWSRFDPLMAEHDICGYNYYLDEAPADHQRVPTRVIMQTESYPRDAVKNFHLVKDNDCVIGDFVWTGIDYLGESGIGRYFYDGQPTGAHYERLHHPWHGAYCGDIDIIGWRKPISHLRELLYSEDNEKLYLAVREPDGYYGKINETEWSVWPTWERWTWKGWEGKPIDLDVFTGAKKVRLYLNNEFIGEKEVKDRIATFTLNYAPGTLRAEAVNDHKGLKAELKTAGKPAAIRLETQAYDELTYITATIVDKNGTPVPDAFDRKRQTWQGTELTFCAEGTELLATASANLTDTIPYSSPKRKTWNSMAQAIVRTTPGTQVTVSAKGLKAQTVICP